MEELLITVKTKNRLEIMPFVTEINKTNNLTALLLDDLDNQNNFQINVYKIINKDT